MTPRTRHLGALLRASHGPTIQAVRVALDDAGGDVRAAARALGMSREGTLHEWLAADLVPGAARQGRDAVSLTAREARATVRIHGSVAAAARALGVARVTVARALRRDGAKCT